MFVRLRLKRNKSKLKNWAKHSPGNYLHRHYLLEAELYRLLGKREKADIAYDSAIYHAKKNGYLNEEAMARELAAIFYKGISRTELAEYYMQKAYYCYISWGAVAKVQYLERKYPQYIKAMSTQQHTTTGNKTISTSRTISGTKALSAYFLDIHSFIKASETLSGEIVLENLLKKMMKTVIENAGAEKGFLILPAEKQWFIQAEYNGNKEIVKVLQSIPIDVDTEYLPISTSVVNYVLRSRENVVLSDAANEGKFTKDVYIREKSPKSVLCMPLLNQGKLNGVLYLENNLTIGAFTENRLETLNLISSQIAISIENATLYKNLQDSLDNQVKLTEAYSRFVPKEFLNLLEKESITNVELGDQIQKEMTILFSDIRAFTTLSENMTPEDNFKFLNSYLKRMQPIITKYNGFIDKYIGDAIMALFAGSADDAVKGSIAMLRELTMYNKHRKKFDYSPIRIGIGLNTGVLMLGTVGGENRMDGTVISDAVNLASRIEGMTKMYGTPLLIGEKTYSKLANPNVYHIRIIDRVTVKGKSEPVTVYEVYDGDSIESAELKKKTSVDFEKGFSFYIKGDLNKAIEFFGNVRITNPDDMAPKVYIERCKKYIQYGLPDNWNGVEALIEK